jgi:hypothetical protein
MNKHRTIIKKGNAKLTITPHGKFVVFNASDPEDKGQLFQTLRDAKPFFCDTTDNIGNCCYRMSSTAASGFTDNCDRCWLEFGI